MKKEKGNDEEIRRQLIIIDSRIERLKRTGRIFFQDHGMKHSGIEKLVEALVEEKRKNRFLQLFA